MPIDPNIIRILAPEQIPQPLVKQGPEFYKYTKDLYDFLRRLFQNLGFILEQINIGTPGAVIVLRKWVDVTQAIVKTYLSDDDFRGRSIRFEVNFFDKVGGASISDANAGVWKQYITSVNNGMGIFRVGTSYSGADVMLAFVTVNTGGDGGSLELWIDGSNGKLFVDSSSGGFGTRYQAELVIEGFEQSSAADIVI